MKNLKKIEIINALHVRTSALEKSKEELIDELFDLKDSIAKQLSILNNYEIIDIGDWGISYYEAKYNDYLMYNGNIIDRSYGFYDGGDFNYYVPPTNYKALIEFCLKSDSIIEEMQNAIEKILVDTKKIIK